MIQGVFICRLGIRHLAPFAFFDRWHKYCRLDGIAESAAGRLGELNPPRCLDAANCRLNG
jgi:hypothetical protein